MTDNVFQVVTGASNIITINRPQARNAVDPHTADALKAAFLSGEEDDAVKVHILTGTDGMFCAGYDLKAVADGVTLTDAPMGPSWLELAKPSIAAVEGYAVAGGSWNLPCCATCAWRPKARFSASIAGAGASR